MPEDLTGRAALRRPAETERRVNKDPDQPPATLRVGFLPFWVENPYQERLSHELAHLGVTVSPLSRSGFAVLAGLLRDRPKIVHLHWLDPLYDAGNAVVSALKLIGSLSALWLLRLTGTRIVWTAHNLTKHENRNVRINRLCTAFVARSADAIITHFPSARDEIIAEFGLKHPARVHVIPHGNYCDTYANAIDAAAARERLGLPQDNLVVLFLGRVRPYKGVLELIEAFRHQGAEDLSLVIAGKPLSEDSQREIEQAIAGDPRIRFYPGFVADEDIQVYMNASDVVVLPYRDVFTSGAAVLAMSFDRACIAPGFGCMTDWLDDGGGILYPTDDPDGLQKSIAKAADNRAGLKEMGRRNGRLARQWSWAHVASETNRVYRSVTGDVHAASARNRDATPD